jgi:radical SAM protein with 4Fe4S-binding SPASM domain
MSSKIPESGNKCKSMKVKNTAGLCPADIYSVNQERHEKITQSKIDINTIYNNVRKLKETKEHLRLDKPHIYIKMIDTFSAENDEFRNTYSSLADTLELERVMNWNGKADFIKNGYQFDSETSYEAAMQSVLTGRQQKNVCADPFYKCMVRANGDVTLCCFDILSDTVVGNINNNSLYKIWNGFDFQNIRADFLNINQRKYKSCSNCEAYLLKTSSGNIDGLTLLEYQKRLNNLSLHL